MVKERIIKWVNDALIEVENTGLSRDVHINNIINCCLENNTNILEASCEVIDIASSYFLTQNKKEKIHLNLYIKLRCTSAELKGVPKNVKKLRKSIDNKSIPELVLHMENDVKRKLPAIEFYRFPLPYSIFDFRNNIQVTYREYRDIDEYKNKERFNRELIFECFPPH